LRRDNVEPFRFLLANDMHAAVAARAGRGLRLDHDLDTRQMRRQRFARSRLLRSPHLELLFGGCGIACLRDRLCFEGELQLVGVELLRAPAELRAL
jgi:hypothetical protein